MDKEIDNMSEDEYLPANSVEVVLTSPKVSKVQTTCKYCSKKVGQSSISRHQSNCSQNPALSKKNQRRPKKFETCQFCSKKIVQSSLARHQFNCSENPELSKNQWSSKKEGTCQFCSKKMGQCNISRHETNCSKNPASTKSRRPKKEKKGKSRCLKIEKTCRFCSKTMGLSNFYRHQTYCLQNPARLTRKLKCENCGVSFSRKSTLKDHMKRCGSSEVQTKGMIPCLHPDCTLRLRTRKSLIEHTRTIHGNSTIAQPIEKTFENEGSFADWKEGEEARTFSYYFQSRGRCKNGIAYYYCQHDGTSKPHRKIGDVLRKTTRKNSRGQIKSDGYCISYMKVTYCTSGSVSVSYYPTHNHPLNPRDIVHHPLPREMYKFIDKQNSLGISPIQIKQNLMMRAQVDGINNEQLGREYHVSTKLIRERAKKYKNSVRYHPDDAQSLKQLTEVLIEEDPNIVLICKPLGMPCVIGPKEINELPENEAIFMYAIQTKEQRQIMIDGCKTILVVDKTNGTNKYDFQLLTMLVVDDNRKGWPVAHCILNKSGLLCMKFFFKAVKDKCPALKINCVMTVDDASLIDAMDEGFSEQLLHLFCKWHLAKALYKQLCEKAPKSLVEDMFVSLKLCIDAKQQFDFEKHCLAFIENYGTLAPGFIEYFKMYYFTSYRAEKWAMCFRTFDHGQVETTGHIESFHKRLKLYYMKRVQNKRIDELVQLLLAIASDDHWERKRSELNGLYQTPTSSNERHSRSLRIPNARMVQVYDNMWSCKSASHKDTEHEVTRLNDKCNIDSCSFKCPFIACNNLCSHLYFCSCSDKEPLCKHIHKVHSVVSSGTVVDFLENFDVDSEMLFFPGSDSMPCDNPTPATTLRENLKQTLKEDCQKILQSLESDEIPTDILGKIQSEVNHSMKHWWK